MTNTSKRNVTISCIHFLDHWTCYIQLQVRIQLTVSRSEGFQGQERGQSVCINQGLWSTGANTGSTPPTLDERVQGAIEPFLYCLLIEFFTISSYIRSSLRLNLLSLAIHHLAGNAATVVSINVIISGSALLQTSAPALLLLRCLWY